MNYRAGMIGGRLSIAAGQRSGTESRLYVEAMTANEIPRPVQRRIMVVDDHPMTRNGIADWIRREQDLAFVRRLKMPNRRSTQC